MTASDLQRALAAAGLAAPVRWEEVTGSTNSTAADLAREGSAEWTLVGAAHQTAGRGRLGRAWEDRSGRALLASLVLRPAIAPPEMGLLPLLAGAALAEAIVEAAGVQALCKWPNDLLIGGSKAGGILMESAITGSRVEFVVLGLGVNLEPPAGVEGAGGVGLGVDPFVLLGAFLRRLGDGYRPREAGFAEAVVGRWTAVAVTPGREVRVRTIDGEEVEGLAIGVDTRGALVVRSGDRELTFASGDVMHLR
jgi:BirA family transcriptional regulator, biotin operon repressor / biotin---[acetyl-CoA-carboxylase] ligase